MFKSLKKFLFTHIANCIFNIMKSNISLFFLNLQTDIIFATTAPEFFQVRRERVKVDKMDRDPSLSPPSSPHCKET